MTLNRYILGSTIVAALGGLLFGFDTAVISGTEDALRQVFSLTESQWGFTVASALIGTILGSVIAGKPAERYGRQPTLLGLAVLYFISAAGCGLAWDWWSLLGFRFIGGLAIGGASVVSPMYIAEISPAQVRGRLVAVSQLNIVGGILVAYFSNYLIAQILGAGHPLAWRWMLGVVAAPSVLFFLCVLFIPESPRWLVKQHRREEALSILEKLGGAQPKQVLNEIIESLHEESVAAGERFFQAKYRVPILLAITIAAFNQLSGINALMYYAPHIFKMAGAGADSALLQSMAVGGTNLIFTVLALSVIDHFGRRKLMLVGSIGYILSLSSTAWAFYTYGTDFTPLGGKVVLISLLVFIASHAFGQGAVIWVFISEVFPNRVRARGQALGSFTHWIMAAAISWSFPMIAKVSGGHTFAFYAVMMILQLAWVLKMMPETKGVPLEQIQRKLGIE
jgi:MFS transporter, SP family, xylose:H+ symportor